MVRGGTQGWWTTGKPRSYYCSSGSSISSSVAVVVLLSLSLLVRVTNGNLCALCQSLRDRFPNEFHSCVLRNYVIRHCDENVDNHITVLKIVGVKRVVRVNYNPPDDNFDGGGGGRGILWEIGVEVTPDYDRESFGHHVHSSGSSHHRSGGSSSSSSSSSSSNASSVNSNNNNNNNVNVNSKQGKGHSGGPPALPPPSHVQLAVIRFSRYPSSLLMQNPCRHVLGTSNSVFGKRRNVPTNGQRISSTLYYFAIDDKMCRAGRGRRKKCIPNPSNLTHPYDCCVQQRSHSSSTTSPHSQSTCASHQSPAPGYQNDTTSHNNNNNGGSSNHHGTTAGHNNNGQSSQHESQEEEEEQPILRPLVLSIQAVCICFTLILSVTVFWIRKSKVIQVSVWPLTESIVFGSMLLYVTVAIRACYDFDTLSESPWWTYAQDPHHQAWACVAEPWARELGFTLVYGGIVLKIYRSLVEFRTRKAHRWVVREKDILRYLGTTIGVVLFYLLAWTCTTQMVGRGEEEWHVEDTGILTNNRADEEVVTCPAITPWHRVTEIGELLYITVGLNMAWHLRTSPVSPFLERQMYTAALIVEASSSVLLIIIRESKLLFFTSTTTASTTSNQQIHSSDFDLHEPPGEEDENATFLLLVYFIRCHVTTTIVLALVLGPKLYYVYLDASTRKRSQLRRGETLSGTLGGGGGGGGGSQTGPASAASLSNLTNLKLAGGGIVGVDHHTLIDLDFAEVSLADMDPQDIKTELKRVYTQLELLRNKTMRKDNPHISKRRGGRKPTHRRFSLQKKGSRDKTAAAQAAMRSRMQAQHAQQGGDSYTNNRSYSSRYNDDIEDSVCSIEGPSTYSEVGGYR